MTTVTLKPILNSVCSYSAEKKIENKKEQWCMLQPSFSRTKLFLV